jgi:maltooligosyltrehalose trehalohydrolase
MTASPTGGRFATRTRWGATLRPDGASTRFRLWAPGLQQVSLEIEGRPPQPMRAEAEGWFQADAPVGAGARYRFRVSPDLAVPDPASRLQAGDVHDASVVVDPRTYGWKHPDWNGRPWHEAVIYEVHAGLLGGFRGVMDHLPRLAALGVTAIELMPLADHPGGHNWGYDGVLPYAPDTALGTPEELKALVDAAHGHGLMMLLDVVYNHFGPEGAYIHAFAKEFFDEGVHTPWGAAIDFRQPAVAAFFEENALYWLEEYRFDGLRFDAVHAIAESDWLDRLAATLRRATEGRHIHLVLENEHNAARHLRTGPGSPGFDAQWNDDWHNSIHPLLTGEAEGYYADFAPDAAQNLARCLAEGFAFQGEETPRGRRRGEPSAHLPPTAFVAFLQNHDQIGNRAMGERLAHLAHPEALAAATALLLLGPQIPLLFMGEEWAASAPFLFFADFHGELAEAVREGRRKEFAHFTAFADEESRARIPDPNALETFRACVLDLQEAARPPHDAMLALHRRLLELRHRDIVPRLPGTQAIAAFALGPRAVLGRWRMGDGARLTIATNLDEAPVAAQAAGPLVFETRPGTAEELAAGRLPPFCTICLMEPAP